jgi:hypothetical protein
VRWIPASLGSERVLTNTRERGALCRRSGAPLVRGVPDDQNDPKPNAAVIENGSRAIIDPDLRAGPAAKHGAMGVLSRIAFQQHFRDQMTTPPGK